MSMTDERALEVLGALHAQNYPTRDWVAAREHIAGRLRGDGEQGQAVAYQTRIPTGDWREASWETYERVSHNRPNDARALYTRPQPVAVAGDAVRALIDAVDAVAPCTFCDDDKDGEWQKLDEAAASARAALSAQTAPSAQRIATGPYVDRLLRIASQKPDDGDFMAKVLIDFAAASNAVSAPSAPVVDDAVSTLVRTAPKRIFLQIADEDYSNEPFPRPCGEEITWCETSCVECEVGYVRADLAHDRAALSAPSEQVTASDLPPPGVPFVGCQCPSCGEEFVASAASVAVPEGWRLVPEKPTERMLDRGWEFGDRVDDRFDRKGAYADLIAAAPVAPGADRASEAPR